jgi:hypothetical protein
MKRHYLLLALLGAFVPNIFFFQFFSMEGLSLGGFLSGLFTNGAAREFIADLLFTSMVFWIFMFHRRSALKSPHPLLFTLLNLTIGLSCALPAYL